MRLDQELETTFRRLVDEIGRHRTASSFITMTRHMAESLLGEIDYLRQKHTEDRALVSSIVENTLKLYTLAKELEHAVEKGKEPKDYIRQHSLGSEGGQAPKAGSRHRSVDGW